MSMHLVGPWLTTTRTKKRSKRKYKSAEDKRQHEEALKSWEKFCKKHKINTEPKKETEFKPLRNYLKENPRESSTKHIPSLNTIPNGVCAKKEPQVYTGTLIKGIATMHKSNAVPITSREAAIEVSKMRRG